MLVLGIKLGKDLFRYGMDYPWYDLRISLPITTRIKVLGRLG
jgi:hypothetical protein